MAPHALAPLIMLPLLTAAWIVPVQFHWELGRFAKFMTFNLYLLGLGGVLFFALGSFLASASTGDPAGRPLATMAESRVFPRFMTYTCWTLWAISVAAYAIWFMPVARNPSLLIAVLSGRGAELGIRDMIGTIPGVTTLVQAQVVYVTLIGVRSFCLPSLRPNRLEFVALLAIVFLALIRNVIWSERLAVIEIVIPLAILYLRRPRFPRLTALMPMFGAMGLFGFFSIFEYFRSWSAYYKYQYDNFFVFILARFSGYYITALDNGAGLVRDWGGIGAPLNTAEWYWQFPWEIGQTYMSKLLGLRILDYNAWLFWNATEEFNNPSGIYMPIVDFGPAGGLVFLFLFGLLTGYIYRSFVRGTFAGLIIFPSWFIGVLELPRIHYLFNTRYFPIIMICLALIFLVSVVLGEERWQSNVHTPSNEFRGHRPL